MAIILVTVYVQSFLRVLCVVFYIFLKQIYAFRSSISLSTAMQPSERKLYKTIKLIFYIPRKLPLNNICIFL
jgi:hypothetical protein